MEKENHELIKELKTISQLSGGYTNTRSIRRLAALIDESFTTDDQQDCVELLQALFSICEPMQEGFKNKISFTDTCQLCQKQTISEVQKHACTWPQLWFEPLVWLPLL